MAIFHQMAKSRWWARKDYYAGALMVLVGVFATLQGVQYGIGRVADIGPGFFPAAIGGILVLTGIGIALSPGPAKPSINVMLTPSFSPPWRTWFCLISSPVLFIFLADHGGLLPATFGSIFVAALADRENSFITAAILAAAMSAVAVVVFWWLIRVQFPLFAWQ